LRSILAQGLIPEVKKKNWDSDKDTNIHTPSRVSYGGIYVSKNLLTAEGAPRDRSTGSVVVVIMELQPNTMYLDEDDIVGSLSGALSRLSDNSYQVGCYYVAATHGKWHDTVQEMRTAYIDRFLRRVEYKFQGSDKALHADLRKRLEELADQAWLPALTRLATQHFRNPEDDTYNWSRCWNQVMSEYDSVTDKSSYPPVEPLDQAVPTVNEAEARFRGAVEPITRSLRLLANTNDKVNATARVTTPIGYHGSNRILAVVEIPTRGSRKMVDGKEVAELVLHYGTIPEDFWRQWKSVHGGEVEVVNSKGIGRTKSASADYPPAKPVVDGLFVRKDVPNTSSIGSSLNEYEVLKGIRVVPMSAFDSAPSDLFYAKDDMERTGLLAQAIRESNEINPLIVVIDEKGPYILEGAHRLGALHILGKKEFPALVVRDLDSEPTSAMDKVAFIPNNVVWLKNYMTMSDRDKGEEVARTAPFHFKEYVEENDPDLVPTLWPDEDVEYIDDFSAVPDALLVGFLEEGGDWLMEHDPTEAPLYLHSDYRGVVKNQWLVHFSDNADAIAKEGFRFGVSDMASLGLTTNLPDRAKEWGGYNFAFLPEHVRNFTYGSRGFKYGKHCVIFRASGVRVYHYGDSEPQVIFWGNDARDIIAVTDCDEGWCLPDDDHGKPVYRNERLKAVVDWVERNFEQYRSVLLTNKDGKPKPGKKKELPKAAAWAPSPSETATLRAIEPRAGEEFKEWLREYLGDEQEFNEAWADDSLRLDYLNDWLRDQHQVDVRDDGYITFWKATPEVEELIGDLPVTVFHHTSSGLVPQIKREGLRGDVRKSNLYQNSGAGVYVTTEVSGPAVEGYRRNSTQRRKGSPVTLEIHTTLRELLPDPDDADIASGAVQFVLPYVAPKDIVFPKTKKRQAAVAEAEVPVQDITETPQFKAWFSGSKVVDGQGRPMVMYHATQTGDIEEFRPFTHFGTQQAANDRHRDLWNFYNDEIKNPARASGSNIMPVYLSVVHPLRLPDLASLDINTGEPIRERDEDDTNIDEDEQYPRGWESTEAIATTLLEREIIDIDQFEECRDNEDALKLLESMGYDGIVYENVVEDPGNDSWIVFRPNQIKSAIGNSGQFDSNSNKITASVEEPQYKPWIGVDLDDTIAVALDDYSDPTKIGEPIMEMVEKVRTALKNGETIKVFTARMADKENAEKIRAAIGDWTEEFVGTRLDATNEKDPGMVEHWDDKARQVEPGTGMFSVADITIVASRETPAIKVADHYDDNGFWVGEGGGASGILPICKSTRRICLAWRSSEVNQGDCFGTLGGAIQKDKNPSESAMSELQEETGYHGSITLHPAFVFSSGSFKYYNFLGEVAEEFELHPEPGFGWETDHIAWVTFEDLEADIKNNPGDYHSGLVALFTNSYELIRRLTVTEDVNGAKQASAPAISVVSKSDIPALLVAGEQSFPQYANLFRSIIIDATGGDFSHSYVAKDQGKVVGGYILTHRSIYNPEVPATAPYRDLRGVEGVALFVIPEYRGSGLGRRLRAIPLDLGADYVWGQQYADLNNLQNWVNFGRRHLFSVDGVHFTVMDLSDEAKARGIDDELVKTAKYEAWMRPWLAGGCFDFALALKEKFREGVFVSTNQSAYPGHVGLKVGEAYYDARGRLTEAEFLDGIVGAEGIFECPLDTVLLNAGLANSEPPYRTQEMARARVAVLRMLRNLKTAGLSKNPALKPDADYREQSNGWALFPDQRDGAYAGSPVDIMVPAATEDELTPEENWVRNV
jgi:8-oxo-dGTP pyrophosphatase MutT (NUDIX family)/GNAT superfamily N-acetyltransferase